jgi:hypothetical protein
MFSDNSFYHKANGCLQTRLGSIKEILCMAILWAGSKVRLSNMESNGDYTHGFFGKHVIDDNRSRHLGAMESENRLWAIPMPFKRCKPIPCLVSGNLPNLLNKLNKNA